ncbi:ATP-binding protein [Rhodobacter sp. M37P]|uniref:ATP-binding protein n=1 Tax=Rhodobacter calidifons TaxID=2715277 RepID=A0ABX0G6H7_9RHOB|nr:ATP-binding protein [Rhodobacter calidifons]
MPDRTDRPPELYLAFRADPASIRRSLAGMLVCPPLSALREDARGSAEVVLAEALNNVAEHAYGEAGGQVEVTLRQETAGIRCLIVDAGRAMPGGTLPEGRLPPDRGPALQDLPEGGFGWHLIRSLCTDLSYSRIADRNHLTFLLPS